MEIFFFSKFGNTILISYYIGYASKRSLRMVLLSLAIPWIFKTKLLQFEPKCLRNYSEVVLSTKKRHTKGIPTLIKYHKHMVSCSFS